MVISGSNQVTSGSYPVTSGLLPGPDELCSYVIPLKNASLYEFLYPKVEWPPTASEAMEVSAL